MGDATGDQGMAFLQSSTNAVYQPRGDRYAQSLAHTCPNLAERAPRGGTGSSIQTGWQWSAAASWPPRRPAPTAPENRGTGSAWSFLKVPAIAVSLRQGTLTGLWVVSRLTASAVGTTRRKVHAMPAQIVIVHDEPEFAEATLAALRGAGYDAIAIMDSMSGIDALEHAKHIELLITRVRFPSGTPNGAALARMARLKRPGIKVLFAAFPEVQVYTEGLGEFLPRPLSTDELLETVGRMLGRHD